MFALLAWGVEEDREAIKRRVEAACKYQSSCNLDHNKAHKIKQLDDARKVPEVHIGNIY